MPKVVLRDARHTSARFSENVPHFSWQAQRIGYFHRHIVWQVQHFRRLLLRVFLRITMPVLREVVTTSKSRGRRSRTSWDCNFACQWQYLVKIRRVWNVLLPGRRSNSDTPIHNALWTLHSTLYTLHPTLFTVHFTLHTLHSTHCTLQCSLYTLHFTLYLTHYTFNFTLYTWHFTSTLYTVYFVLYT